jgi:hypothetical protein
VAVRDNHNRPLARRPWAVGVTPEVPRVPITSSSVHLDDGGGRSDIAVPTAQADSICGGVRHDGIVARIRANGDFLVLRVVDDTESLRGTVVEEVLAELGNVQPNLGRFGDVFNGCHDALRIWNEEKRLRRGEEGSIAMRMGKEVTMLRNTGGGSA